MRTALILTLIAIGLAPAALADIPASERGRIALASFNAIDSDGDGGLSLAELRALGPKGGAALFDLLDTGTAGRLWLTDFAHRRNAALLARLKAGDPKGRGYVERAQFVDKPVDPVLFAALDVNGDGRLSLAELRPVFAGWRATPQAPPPVRQVWEPEPDPTPYCWVPIIGGGRGPRLEMPVITSDGCRTE